MLNSVPREWLQSDDPSDQFWGWVLTDEFRIRENACLIEELLRHFRSSRMPQAKEWADVMSGILECLSK